jgi:xylulokinase
VETIQACCQDALPSSEPHEIILTGQAESLVIIGSDGTPLRNAISWLDERSKNECRELEQVFNKEIYYRVTGQVSILPTWPITKILWVREHEEEIFSAAKKYLLLKDYIQYRLTGKLVGEYSIYNFSFYFDIRSKSYWKDILDYVGVKDSQLPELVEPCTNIGRITAEAARDLRLPASTTVNVGTLDHFANMIGTGNIKKGVISETTGTVLTVATLVDADSAKQTADIPCHYGPFKDSYVLLSVCESGGISLDWYKNNFLCGASFDELEGQMQQRQRPGEILFLPYLTGTNAPEYEENANGVFYGLKIKHDAYDLALALLEGVAYMLANNIDLYRKLGIDVTGIISTGGGAQSQIWCQIKADVTGCDVSIPEEKEAACLGAAMIGAIDSGAYASFEEAVAQKVAIAWRVQSQPSRGYRQSHMLFNKLFRLLQEQLW